MEQPIISIIIPVFNSGAYLDTAVYSILNQDSEDIELILVDDGSTDGSSQRCDDYAKKDKRVKVIHQKNGGICAARNTALKIARGEYIGFSDHDDKFTPGVWSKCIQIIKEKHYPDMIKFGKRYTFINENNVEYRNIHMTLPNKQYNKEEIVKGYLTLRQQNVFRFVWDGLYKNEIIRKNNITFDTYFTRGGEDHDFCNTYSRYIKNLVTIEDEFYIHYLRKNFSTSSKKIKDANTLYYKVESNRLYETLQYINYDIKANKAIYWNQFFESCVLPVISYHLKNGTDIPTIIKILQQFEDSAIMTVDKKISLNKLIKQSQRIGVFTYCYLRKYFKILFFIINLRYKLIKS